MTTLRSTVLAALLFSPGAFSQPAPGPLTDQRIMELVRAGVRPDELGRMIATAPEISFDLSPAATGVMLKAGVSEETIRAMSAREQPVPAGITRPVPGAPAASGISTQPIAYQGGGMFDVGLSGTVLIPHISTDDTIGIVQGELGYFVGRGSEISSSVIGLFTQNADDVFVNGGYKYFFGKETSKVRPYLGASAGVNVETGSGETNTNFLAVGGGGIRYFVTPHVAIDFGYGLYYTHIQNATFQESTLSAITVGFAHVFNRR